MQAVGPQSVSQAGVAGDQQTGAGVPAYCQDTSPQGFTAGVVIVAKDYSAASR